MAKGDDVRIKKKNKALRKKLNKDPSAVSARIASLIAAKKRRQSGKRRQCQGMCFSLPTPENPYNERLRKEDKGLRKSKKPPQSNNMEYLKDEGDRQQKKRAGVDEANSVVQKAKILKQMGLESQHKIVVDDLEKEKNDKLPKGKFRSIGSNLVPRAWQDQLGKSGCPSKFLCNCLNSIQYSLVADGELKEQEKPLFGNSWGVELYKSYSLGKDILANSRTSSSAQQIAWIASTAADSITRKEKERMSCSSPFLLYLVPSQEKAIKVRSICKPLKAFGIHTVCVHPGALLEHQINGLKSCDPEFLIATPERLRELVSLKAIDISVVSLLVVDAVDSFSNCLDKVKCIRESISGNPQTIVFQGCCDDNSVQAIKTILREPLHLLSLDGSINS